MEQISGNSSFPPTFNATVNNIDIDAEKASKLTGVTLYTGRAEVTREVRLSVVTGQNKVMVTGLSSFMDSSTLRVEGNGAATIQGVAVSITPQPPKITTSYTLDTIRENREEVEAAVVRYKRSREAVENYLKTLDAQHVDGEKLNGIINSSEENLERLDKKLARLQKELDVLRMEGEQEEGRLNPPFNTLLRKQVDISLFAERDGQVNLVLKYATSSAKWYARYDIRVNTQAKEKHVKLIYQATVIQGTAEDWTDIPLLLETNTPTYSVNLPTLPIESLEIKESDKEKQKKRKPLLGGKDSRFAAKQSVVNGLANVEEESEDDMGFAMLDGDGDQLRVPDLSTIAAHVHSQGAVSTTYKVPGLATIPCDNKAHNITIVELDLDATLSWITVPKLDARAYLQARVKNTSDYLLLRGNANVYVDGAFHSTTSLNMTNSQETFSCSLGLDPAVRITYHPRVEKSSQSGLINKTATKIFTQRITITNTKLIPIETVKVMDGIPISKDARITVKLKNPELAFPSLATTIQRSISGTGSIRSGVGGNGELSRDDGGKTKNRPAPTKVSSNPLVLAQWQGVDDESVQTDALGQDGRVNWVVSELGSMEVVNLTLVWEVAVAEGLQLVTNKV